jgi:hypothetical protein
MIWIDACLKPSANRRAQAVARLVVVSSSSAVALRALDRRLARVHERAGHRGHGAPAVTCGVAEIWHDVRNATTGTECLAQREAAAGALVRGDILCRPESSARQRRRLPPPRSTSERRSHSFGRSV